MVKPIKHSSLEGEMLQQAALQIRREEEGRKVPSPSSYSRCMRQTVGKALGLGVDNEGELDHESLMAAESGRMTENVLRDLIEAAGIGTILRTDEELVAASTKVAAMTSLMDHEFSSKILSTIGMKGGQFDDLMIANAYKGMPKGLKAGDLVLVEYKRKGMFNFLSLWEEDDDGGMKGVFGNEQDSGEFSQAQAYMNLLGVKWGFYFAANWDRSALTYASNNQWVWKKKDYRPSGFYTEWIEAGEHSLIAEGILDRTTAITSHIEAEDDLSDVPREYDPFTSKFPCPYCPIFQACKEAG